MEKTQSRDIDVAIWSDGDDSVIEEKVGEQGIDFTQKVVEILELYWKRRVLAASIIGAGIVISIVYAISLPNYYVANTTLMPQDNTSPYSAMLSMFSTSGPSTSLGSEALGLSTPSDLQVSILQSRKVLDALIARYGLMDYYKAHFIEEARKALAGDTKIEQDKKSGVITVSVRSSNPELARKLADSYVEELNHVLTDSSTSAARRERQFLEGRLKDIKQELEDSSKALSQFSSKNMALDIPSQARALVEGAGRTQSLIIESESQLAALKQTYSEDNYRVKAVEARISELKRQMALNANSVPANSGGTSKNPSYPGGGDLPTLGVAFSELERRVRADEAIWETLTKQYETARVEEAKEIPTIHVLDPAFVPNHKAGPRRSLIVYIGTLLATLLSCLVIFGQAQWESLSDDSVLKRLAARFSKNAPKAS